MIVFKNDSASVEWNPSTNTIICNWKNVSNIEMMDEIIQSIIEIRNENEIQNYVSNRSKIQFSWSGFQEWNLFIKNSLNSIYTFKDIVVIDPQVESNKQLLSSFESITDKVTPFINYKTIRNYKVYQSLAEGYALK